MVVLCVVIVSLYALLIFVYAYGWFSTPEFSCAPSATEILPRISVIVPARNEAANIKACLQALLDQDYPSGLLEIFIVDDHSEDDTAAIVRSFQSERIRLLQLKDYIEPSERVIAYKKKAITVAVEACSGELVVLTDADCVAGAAWLSHLAALYCAEQPKMIVAPVRYSMSAGLLGVFQLLDFSMMQGITCSVIRQDMGIMCNGANLGFSRDAFLEVGGYDGVDHIVSGDDYLLQLKLKQRFGDGIAYLKSKDAVVQTQGQDSWRGFLQQRIRWASKTGKYPDPFMTGSLLLVYLANLVLLFAGIAALFSTTYRVVFFFLLIEKILVEIVLLQSVLRFFGQARLLIVYPFLQPLHILYIILAGFLSRISRFEWKARNNYQA